LNSSLRGDSCYKGKVHPRRGHDGLAGGWGSVIALLFNLGASWGRVVNAPPRVLYPRERDPVSIEQEAGGGGWPRAGRGVCVKSRRHRDSIPGPYSP
jgi:hypothetical protein